MKIHEYQGKAILAKYGVAVPRGEVAFTPDEARAIAERLGGGVVVVKAQIHAGGRGKGGGVKVAKSPAEAAQLAEKMLGMTLVTHQTGPDGRLVKRVLVEEGLQMNKEFYLGVVLDRASGCPVVMASSEGGVEIEKVAHETPDLIKKVFVNPAVGLQAFQARQLAFAIGLEPVYIAKAVKLMLAIYDAYIKTDASMVEINPLVTTADGTCWPSTRSWASTTARCSGIPTSRTCATSARRTRSRSRPRSSR